MRKLKMREHGQKGMLVTFCGLDGCGKSTMIELLKEKLKLEGESISLTKQPTSAVRRSKIFRNYMDSEDHRAYEYRALSLMAASDRIQHSNKEIIPKLSEGKIVISDRYIYSCLANLRARGYEKDKWIYEISENIPKPDIAFFLDLPVELAVRRVRSREDEKNRYIDMELQYRLRDEYKKICRSNGGVLLCSDRDVNDTFNEVCEYIEKIKEKKGYGN